MNSIYTAINLKEITEFIAQLIFIILFVFSIVNMFNPIFSFFKSLLFNKKLKKYINDFFTIIDAFFNKIATFSIFKNSLKAILVLEFISISIYYRWLSFDAFVSGDHHWVSAKALSYFSFPTAWTTLISLGEPNWSLWNAYYSSFIGFFGGLGLSGNIVLNVVIFWFIIFIAPIISFLFIKKFTKNIFTAFTFSLLLLFNSYVLTNVVAGHLLLSVAFYISMLSFLNYIIFIESKFKKTHLLIISALLSWTTGFIDFRIFYLLTITFLIYQLFYLLLNKIKVPFRLIIVKNLLFFSILLLLNLNWLLPTIFIKETNSILGRGIFAKGLIDLFDSWSGTYYYWSLSNKIVWGIDTGFPVIFILFPLFSILVLYFSKKTTSLLIFMILFLVGSFFGKQNTAPFARVYEFMFANFPGFSAFRDATKFFQITWWSLSALLTIGYENIKNKIVKNTLMTVVISITLFNIFSLIKYQNHLLLPISIPGYYQDLLDAETETFGRVLWVPGYDRFFVASATNPRINLYEINDTSWAATLNGKDDDQNDEEKTVLKNGYGESKTDSVLKNKKLKMLVTMSSTKYLFIPKQLQTSDQTVDDDAFYYGDDRREIIETLEGMDWLKKREIKSSEASIYEVKNFRPHFYLTKELETFNNVFDLDAIEIESEHINPSIYNLHLKNIKETIYLTFTDSYSDDWLIGPQFVSFLDFATWKRPSFISGIKSKNEAGGNVFKIDKEFLASITDGFEENPDGSININLTMYYSPQKQLVWGNIITIITLTSLIAYLVGFFVKKYKHKKRND